MTSFVRADVIPQLADAGEVLERAQIPEEVSVSVLVPNERGLDAAHAVHVVAWKGTDKKVDDLFGKSGAAGNLVVAASQPEAVYAAKGYSSYLYAKEAKDFRKKEILKFDDAALSQVTVTNPHGAYAFAKGDKWTGTVGGKPIPRFDEEKVKNLLNAFKGLNAEDFGDGKSLADTGLDKPEGTVTVHFKDDTKPAELLVGGVSTGTNHWAKRGDEDTIYQVTSFTSDWANAESTKFQSAADAGAPDGGGKKK